MRLLKVLVILFIILAAAVLLANNSNQYLTIWLYPGQVLQDINLATTLVATLAIGIVMGFAIGLLQILSQKRQIGHQNRQLKKLRTELNNLRHSGLDEGVFPEDSDGSHEMEDSPVAASEQLIHLER